MVNVLATGQKLECLGIEAFEALDNTIAGAELGEELPSRMSHLVLIGDAHAQQALEHDNKSPEAIGDMWVPSAVIFMEKALRLGRIAQRPTGLRMLSPNLREIHILEYLHMREELFGQNPQYDGECFGHEYSEAVATGRLRLKP